MITKLKNCKPSHHALLEDRLTFIPKYSPIVDDCVHVPSSDTGADMNRSPVKTEVDVVMSNKDSRENFFESEFQVLIDLIENIGVDLLQRSFLVTYIQDYLEKKVVK